jgi:hypothetical protein
MQGAVLVALLNLAIVSTLSARPHSRNTGFCLAPCIGLTRVVACVLLLDGMI